MIDLEDLIKILESSVEKHGEQPLTNKWLLNIYKMALRNQEREILRDGYCGLTMDDIL